MYAVAHNHPVLIIDSPLYLSSWLLAKTPEKSPSVYLALASQVQPPEPERPSLALADPSNFSGLLFPEFSSV